MPRDVRWKQRFQNFQRAFKLLADALANGPGPLSNLEKEGVVQRFEFTFELSWKTLKDYLDSEGVVISPITPRQVLKEAFAAKIIADGQVWIDMLNYRNLLSHVYDERRFEKAVDAIAQRFLPAITALHAKLLKKNRS